MNAIDKKTCLRRGRTLLGTTYRLSLTFPSVANDGAAVVDRSSYYQMLSR